jgi:hypothetical protein
MNQLIKLGDMSVLNEHIFPVPDKPHSFGATEEHQEDVVYFIIVKEMRIGNILVLKHLRI